MIEIPDFEWFINRQSGGKSPNAFSGSFGTDKSTGCLNVDTLNYTVKLTGESIVCNCFIIKPWKENSAEIPFGEASFSKDEQGVADASAWLNEKAKAFINK